MKRFTPFTVGEMPESLALFSGDLVKGQRVSDSRAVILISAVDADRIKAARVVEVPVPIFDFITEEQFVWRWAECGAGCRCAAEITWVR